MLNMMDLLEEWFESDERGETLYVDRKAGEIFSLRTCVSNYLAEEQCDTKDDAARGKVLESLIGKGTDGRYVKVPFYDIAMEYKDRLEFSKLQPYELQRQLQCDLDYDSAFQSFSDTVDSDLKVVAAWQEFQYKKVEAFLFEWANEIGLDISVCDFEMATQGRDSSEEESASDCLEKNGTIGKPGYEESKRSERFNLAPPSFDQGRRCCSRCSMIDLLV